MLLALVACTPAPDPGTPAPTTMEWLYGAVEAPPDDRIVGAIQLVHHVSLYGAEPSFGAGAWLLEEALVYAERPWSDPFEGLGDCGVWTERLTVEGTVTRRSAGTIFLDAGLEQPLPLVAMGGGYLGTSFAEQGWGPVPFGAVFAVAAVGDAYPTFLWDPAFALPAAPMIVTSPAEPDWGPADVAAGALPITWEGSDPYATVTIEIVLSEALGAHCEVPDTGAFTVPADIMANFAGEWLDLDVTRSLTRYEAIEPERYVTLYASSTSNVSVRVE